MRALASSQTPLRGRKLLAARAAWIVLTMLIVGLSVAALPVAHAQYQTVCAGCRSSWRLKPEDLVALKELGVSTGFYAGYLLAIDIVYMLGFWVVGVIIFWKKSSDRLSLFFSFMLVIFGTVTFVDLPSEIHPTLTWLGRFFSFFGYAAFFVAFLVFPDGRFVPRWTRWSVIIWVLYDASLHFLPDDPHFHPPMWILLIGLPLVLGLFGIMVSAQIYRYLRVSGPIERQQTKWVVFGLTVAIVMSFGVSWLGELFPMLNRPGAPRIVYVLTQQTLNDISLLLIPLTITVAILKFRLWDIDLIINRTIVYGSLSAVLAAVFVLTDTLLLPLLVQSVLGKDNPSLNAVVAALIIAVLFEPLRRRIKEGVDRLTDWLAGSHSTGEPPR